MFIERQDSRKKQSTEKNKNDKRKIVFYLRTEDNKGDKLIELLPHGCYCYDSSYITFFIYIGHLVIFII